ncbi:MAG: hypothetical protein ABIT20_09615 [Gemmatimonadaceae bacterium]
MSLTARLSRSFLSLALTLAASGCAASEVLTSAPEVKSYETGSQGIQAGYVGVTPTASGLRIVNQTERPVHLMAVNADTLALLDWAPCTGGTNCPALAQGAVRDIAWAAVMAYSAETKQFTVMWWNVVYPPSGTPRAENLHNITVTR